MELGKLQDTLGKVVLTKESKPLENGRKEAKPLKNGKPEDTTFKKGKKKSPPQNTEAGLSRLLKKRVGQAHAAVEADRDLRSKLGLDQKILKRRGAARERQAASRATCCKRLAGQKKPLQQGRSQQQTELPWKAQDHG